jgi:SagB-type dehydrogenase family enzyme
VADFEYTDLRHVDELLSEEESQLLWELFHENSKISRFERHPTFVLHPSDHAVVRVMRRLQTVKPYRDRAKVALPGPADWPPARHGFDEVVLGRETARSFTPAPIGLAPLAKVLHHSYGITRDNEDTPFPRPFRAVPSGGALYPLELYVQAVRVDGLAPGLYHYDPEDRTLDVLRLAARHEGAADEVAALFMQPDLARSAAAIVFVSALFFRSTFKYGDRGYRFTLLEAGHLAQNALLTAHSIGLAGAPVGGYADRDVDRYLRFDGLSESTVYVLLIGRPGPEGA